MNKNEFELNGKRYKAVPSDIKCPDCAFYFEGTDCTAAPPCIDYGGEKGMNVIFVEVSKIKTNGDRLRAMSNEELAEFIVSNVGCNTCKLLPLCDSKHVSLTCGDVWLDWINSPAGSEEVK